MFRQRPEPSRAMMREPTLVSLYASELGSEAPAACYPIWQRPKRSSTDTAFVRGSNEVIVRLMLPAAQLLGPAWRLCGTLAGVPRE